MKKYSDLIKEIKSSENFKNSSWESRICSKDATSKQI